MRAHSILVVEDDEAIRDVICELIAVDLPCWTVECAGTIAHAKAALARRRPDVLLLDLMLPDGSGEEILRDLAETKSVPPAVIVLSASISANTIAKAYGVPLVAKPFDLQTLVDAIVTASG